jgi:anti-anti-sigma factor
MVRTVERSQQTVSVAAGQQLLQRTIPPLERSLDEAIGGKPGGIDLVLSQVQIVDSAGLNWLLSMLGRLQTLGIALRLAEPSPIMADALLATRLDARFIVVVGGVERGAAGGEGVNGGGNHGRS